MQESKQKNRKIVLVAPNVSEKMGGEAIKIYQYFVELNKRIDDICLVTHARCREDLSHLDETHSICFVRDDLLMKFFWHSYIFRAFVTPLFFLRARAIIRSVITKNQFATVHYVCPISPILPRFPLSEQVNLIGPINGNIGYPPAFSAREGFRKRLASASINMLAMIHRHLIREEKKFSHVLVSGYDRTRSVLQRRGFLEHQMTNVVDSGVSNKIFETPRTVHEGKNTRFVFLGRFVDYKALDLAICSIARVNREITLDAIGDGECAARWKDLAEELGVQDRVRFVGWKSHGIMLKELRKYRGLVCPSLAEANGIVVQEAMALGVPVIALKWGGPAELVNSDTGILVEPLDVEHVVREIAAAMVRLSEDGNEADRLSKNARETAERHFSWDAVIKTWTARYYN